MKSMKYFLGIFFSIVTVAEIFAQDGLSKRAIEPFSAIEVNGSLIIFISQASENSISGTDETLRNLNYEISNGKLKISQGGNSANTSVYLNASNLEKIIVNGISDIRSSNTITTESLELIVSGASKANILFEGKKLKVDASGASEIRAGGACEILNLELSGASSFKAYKLKTGITNVEVTGNSEANLNGEGADLTGEVSGVSKLSYSGEPIKINVEAIGLGKIIKSNGLEIEASDTTKLSFGRNKVIIYQNKGEIEADLNIDGHNKEIPKPKKQGYFYSPSIWSGFELGINGYLNNQNSLGLADSLRGFDLNYANAFVVNINPYEAHLRIINNRLFLTTGFGFEINNYRFNSKMRMIPDTRPLQTVLEDSSNYKRNKLTTMYLNVPLYMSISLGNNKQRFTISPGVTAGWLIRSYQKRILDDDGKNKIRTRDDFNLQPFRFNASLRLNYRDVTVFANYSLNELFYAGRGPELYPFSVGVQLVGF